MWFEHRFEVVGHVPFPIDMLRYDSCFPATVQDSKAITESLEGPHSSMKTVALVCLTHKTDWRPAADRWRACGWTIRLHSKQKTPSFPER
ncbi:MAG: hypothetical protein KA354_06195 [Phycisphaerae bacterium]|nr:hypothetical protein [Phycisphaerae bacterium]